MTAVVVVVAVAAVVVIAVAVAPQCVGGPSSTRLRSCVSELAS